MGTSRHLFRILVAALGCAVVLLTGSLVLGQGQSQGAGAPPAAAAAGQELPIHKIPIPGEAAEGYFSPDG